MTHDEEPVYETPPVVEPEPKGETALPAEPIQQEPVGQEVVVVPPFTEEGLPGQLPITALDAEQEGIVSYYDAEGRLLLWAQGGIMDPPEGTASQAVVALGSMVEDTWYDGLARTVRYKSPFKVKVESRKITGIPKGTRVFLDGQLHIVDNGEIATENPEGAIARLIHFKHHTQDVEIPK